MTSQTSIRRLPPVATDFIAGMQSFGPQEMNSLFAEHEWGQGVGFGGASYYSPLHVGTSAVESGDGRSDLRWANRGHTANGWLYRINTNDLPDDLVRVLAAMPSRCCRCDEDWTRTGGNSTEDATAIEDIASPIMCATALASRK